MLLFVLSSFFWQRYPLMWSCSLSFEESQTLSRFMHVYKTANTCNIASTGVNEMRNFLRLKHIFMQPSCFMQLKPPGILSCHRYSVGSLLSFRWRALVSSRSGHALQGQTCQDLATYNIKHSFSQRKPGRFPKLPDRFFLVTPLCSTDWSFLRPGRFIFLLLFDSVFQRQEATKIKQEKNSLM